MKGLFTFLMTGTLLTAAGCTWVSPNPQVKQQGIMVLPQDRVAHCRMLSKTEVSIADKVGFLARTASDVESDLKNLAMNQAATQGGDTVSALTPVDSGSQTFGIYKCLGGNSSAATAAPSAGSSIKTTPYQPPR
ncbi:MAG: DUF4156 domain-containing protein [Gammaproteobacteria bacterium]